MFSLARMECRQHDLLCLVLIAVTILVHFLYLFDGQKQPLLVTQFVKADVLQILDTDGGDPQDGGVPLS